MKRTARIERNTKETSITAAMNLDGSGIYDIKTGIPFFDHMLSLFSAHGFFDFSLEARGDLEVDSHHTVEDVGLVMGSLLSEALGERQGIARYGHAVTPMDETLTSVTLDLSNRPYLVYNIPNHMSRGGVFDGYIAKEFFQAFAVKGGLNLHINVHYGDNEHHILESVFKALGRALDQAVSIDERIEGLRSTKGVL